MNQKQKMRVSFDLDEVLFVSPNTHKTEPPLPFPLRNIGDTDGTGGYLVHGHVKERDEVRNVMRTSLFLLNS